MKVLDGQEYKVQTRGDDGKPGAATVKGSIVGPFGVADDQSGEANEDAGCYRVTHLHSGLKIAQLSSPYRDRCIAAAMELAERAPFWASHKPERIAKENGLEGGRLRELVDDIARKHGCLSH